MENTENLGQKLRIGLFETGKVNSEQIEDLFRAQEEYVEEVKSFGDKQELFKGFKEKTINALVINIFNIKEGIDIIRETRKEYNSIPICILGTEKQLASLKDVPANWKVRFRNYNSVIIDDLPKDLNENIRYVAQSLLSYWMAKTAKQLIESNRTLNERELEFIKEALAKNIDSGKKHIDKSNQNFIPGVNEIDLKEIIKETLEESKKSIKRYRQVNIAITIVGLVFILVSFIFVCIIGDSKMLAFGGLGLAGVITSLITNPTALISKTARQLIQIQINYFSYLKQVKIIKEMDKNEKSKRLEEVTNSLQETLCKYFDSTPSE
jgi:DNA-binding NarL/FixJ family response regulator